MNRVNNEEHAHQDKRFKPSQIDSQVQIDSQNLDFSSHNNRQKVDVQKIIDFVKYHNSTTSVVAKSIEQDEHPAIYHTPVPNKGRKNPPETKVERWIIDEETSAIAHNKMIASQQLKIPIVIVIDFNNALLWRVKPTKPIHLRPHVHEFVEFIMKNFYIINWTPVKPLSSIECVNETFGPYKDYLLCNLTKIHTFKVLKDMKRPYSGKDLNVIWKHTFMIDPTSVMKTLPSPPVASELQSNYENEVNMVPDCADKNLFFGIDSNSQPLQNAGPLKFDKTNTILIEGSDKCAKLQPENLIMVNSFKSIKTTQDDIELPVLKYYLQTLATRYREEFDKCEAEDIEFNFSVVDYMKKNSFEEAHGHLSSIFL